MADGEDVSKKVKEIKDKTKAVLESDTNSNFIVDILELSETQDEKVLVAFVRSAHKIFTTFSSRGKLHRQTKQKRATKEVREETSSDPQDVFSYWLHEKYLLTLRRLLNLLRIGSQNVKEFALCTLMKFLVEEAKQVQKFPNVLFRQTCDALFDGKYSMKDCIERFAEYLEYDDVRFYVLKNLGKILGDTSNSTGSQAQHLVENVFAMLNLVKMKEKDEELNNLLTEIKRSKKRGSDKIENNVLDLKQHRNVFTAVWIAFLALPLTSEIHKKVLLNLHSDVLPHLTEPKLLMDFLTDSYNTGGVTSLLALNSLFVLIHKHNLDYPDFFKKLYALFGPNIFYVKYQARFFHLADLFLMSTHLPAYLVAAFVKRLSRLALSAPPSGAMLVIPFVCNLIKRHPSVQVLIHRKQRGKLLLDEGTDESTTSLCQGDPFIADEQDPAKCDAMKSSLWELKTLQSHFYPTVASLVEMLEKPLGAEETDISEYFDQGYDQLFQKECKKITTQNAHLEFQAPKGIISKRMSDHWVLE